MKINRPKSTENIRSFLLSLVMMTALSLIPMLSHAALFWDDEMEQGNTDFSAAYMLSTMIPQGVMAYDTTVKYSGTASVRMNYPVTCKAGPSGGQCGGSLTQAFPPTDEVWKRVYFRMSGTGPNPSASGLFETSVTAFTKMLKSQSAIVNGLYARYWWVMGCCGSKKFLVSMENVPSPGRARNVYSNFAFSDNRWYCIEAHEKMNTPGLPDGIAEAWVDGVYEAGAYDVIWRQAGSTLQWKEFSIIRQEGVGNLWFDRFAAGNTRIGCLGATSASDTTPPGPPQGLLIR